MGPVVLLRRRYRTKSGRQGQRTRYPKIIRSWHEQLPTNKSNLEDMDTFLETYNLARWVQEEIESLSRMSINMEVETVESVTRYLPTKKTQDQLSLRAKSTKHLKKSLYQSLLKLFQKTEGTLLSYFHEASVTLILKPDQKKLAVEPP